MIDNNDREISIVFTKDFKGYVNSFGKKNNSDYILNVNKIIKDKFNSKFLIPNRLQAFIINYEIKKLLNKSIYIKNQKYTNIIYLNSMMSQAIINNAILFIESEYKDVYFDISIIKSESDDWSFEKDISVINI